MMKNKYSLLVLLLVVALGVSIVFNIKVVSKLKKYEDYHSQKVGNSIRPAASNAIKSKNILEEIVKNKKIDENQYQELEVGQLTSLRDLHELRYFANRVINTKKKYDIPSDYIDFLNYLRRFKYDNEFSNRKFDYTNPKEKILTSQELEKFQIMKLVMTDYSNIFIKGLSDYKTGELENSKHFYDYEYNMNNEKWILVLEKIFQYNRDSQYKDKF